MEVFTGIGLLINEISYSLRYELAFCACALLGWIVSAAAQRKGEKARARKVYSATLKTKASKASPAIANDGGNSLVPAYRRTCSNGPDDVLRLFDHHRKSLAFDGQTPESLQEIFSMVYSAVVRAGYSKSLPKYIQNAAALGVLPNAQQVESMLKMCTAKKCFAEALLAFDSANCKDSEVTDCAWSCLLFCAVEAGKFDRCAAFYEKLRTLREPASEDFMNMIRFVVHTKQPEQLAPILTEMRGATKKPDNIAYNRALAVCIVAEQLDMAEQLLEEMQRQEGVCDAITYNTMIKGCVRCGKIERCFAIHEDMLKQGIVPSEVTFGILLDACITAGMLDRAAKVFRDFKASGCKLNAVLYTTLIKGLAQAGQVDQAQKTFEQMCAAGVTPDLVSYSVLIKVYCDAGKVEVSLDLLERLVQQGLMPDEIVYNNLLLGCAERKSSALGQRLLADMQGHGIKPSSVTISIMLKIYVKCQEWDAAIEMLDTSYAKFKLPCDSRLYVQLLQSCIRNRQGKHILEICEAMLKRCSPDEATTGRLLQQCISFNMLDTGAEILERVLPPRGRVGAKDANALLASAQKKHKVATVKAILAAMEKGKIPVESRIPLGL